VFMLLLGSFGVLVQVHHTDTVASRVAVGTGPFGNDCCLASLA
jgi:hypothetical protein